MLKFRGKILVFSAFCISAFWRNTIFILHVPMTIYAGLIHLLLLLVPILEGYEHGDLEASLPKHGIYHEHAKVLKLLRNKEVIFMGDSLTRYQYLNFIGFLHTGQWASRKPSLESAKGWDGFAVKFSWDLSMKISNLRFGGYEICDCYRDEKHTIEIPLSEAQRYHNNVLGMKENRHYFDPIQNISVKYFWWTGYPFLMSAIPKITDFEDIDFNFRDQLLHNFSATYEHRYDTVESFLMEQIKPRNPDILIINMGMWQDSPALKALNENPKNFADALKAAAKAPIWKTTTPLVKSNAYEILKPFSVGDEVYEDPCHFKPPMYALVNKHMLLLFEEILL